MGKKLKRLGVAKGFPDVGIFISQWADNFDINYYGAFLEFKIKPNMQSAEQKVWEKRLRMNGFLYVVAWSADEAIKVTEEYFK